MSSGSQENAINIRQKQKKEKNPETYRKVNLECSSANSPPFTISNFQSCGGALFSQLINATNSFLGVSTNETSQTSLKTGTWLQQSVSSYKGPLLH
jgi:hypothetical protein